MKENKVIRPVMREGEQNCPATEVVVVSNQLLSAKSDNDIDRQIVIMSELTSMMHNPILRKALKDMQTE